MKLREGVESIDFQDPTLSLAARAADLICSLTLDEKISQMIHPPPASSGLGILEFNW